MLPFDILNMLFHVVLYVNGSMYVCTYASIWKSNPIKLIMIHMYITCTFSDTKKLTDN